MDADPLLGKYYIYCLACLIMTCPKKIFRQEQLHISGEIVAIHTTAFYILFCPESQGRLGGWNTLGRLEGVGKH